MSNFHDNTMLFWLLLEIKDGDTFSSDFNDQELFGYLEIFWVFFFSVSGKLRHWMFKVITERCMLMNQHMSFYWCCHLCFLGFPLFNHWPNIDILFPLSSWRCTYPFLQFEILLPVSSAELTWWASIPLACLYREKFFFILCLSLIVLIYINSVVFQNL